MGAFGSCLGVGRPIRPDTNPRLLVRVSVPGDGSARHALRHNQFLTNGSAPANVRSPFARLHRQTSALANGDTGQQAPFQHSSPSSQIVPKLVDIDDNVPLQNSHSICNRESALRIDRESSNPTDCITLVALYDYAPRTDEDLGFKKGEHLETTRAHIKNEWWYAWSKLTKKSGYVPSNYVTELNSIGAEPWYFGRLSRATAEAMLKSPGNKDGTFIIRDSQSLGPNHFSLSLKHSNEVKHYKIAPHEDGGLYINKKLSFMTLYELVIHYSKSADGLCIKLLEPCQSRFEPPTIIGLSYDTSDKWEIDREQIKLLHELGRGQFGQVFEGLYKLKTRVAVKTLRKGTMDPQDFLAEAQIMKNMNHQNLVQLFAVCTKQEPVYIITELMAKGALINYLHTNEGRNLEHRKYIHMAAQIAAGMAYLERENYVHRDLAARNILVGENNVCKIADFGLARFIKESEYEARQGAKFPIKWTAPEAANHSKFTIKSDVWSFGIVLFEIITKGGTPYPDMSNAEVLTKIDHGYRMQQPPNCEDKYYRIMMDCWKKDPSQRPTFETLEWKLNDYFISDEQYKEAPDQRER